MYQYDCSVKVILEEKIKMNLEHLRLSSKNWLKFNLFEASPSYTHII
jgi:hypothetical protein